MNKESYGMEVILDMKDCDVSTFTRKSIRKYFKELCELIDMIRCDMHWWDDFNVPEGERQTEAHTSGISAVQFILTSNITIHTLDLTGELYVNIFSCKSFNPEDAINFTKEWFRGKVNDSHTIKRGVYK